MSKLRGFEVVADEFRTAFSVLTDEKKNKITIPIEIKLPTRTSAKSAGYDFYIQKDVQILPGHKTIIWSDVKAFMQPDEVLKIYIRSSKGIKEGLMIPNNVGIIDSDYYSNENNDGNIAIALVNTSGRAVNLRAGDRIVQGIFSKFLTADETVDTVRKGGIGSSDEKDNKGYYRDALRSFDLDDKEGDVMNIINEIENEINAIQDEIKKYKNLTEIDNIYDILTDLCDKLY